MRNTSYLIKLMLSIKEIIMDVIASELIALIKMGGLDKTAGDHPTLIR